MRRVYKGEIPRNIKKAFAERLRQARIKGETGTAEYKRIMELRSKGEITLDIAQNALRKRKRKVSRETLSPRELMERRKRDWIDKGLEYSTQYQSMLKKSLTATDKQLEDLFKIPSGYEEKKIKLNSLLEEHKEYIYMGAMQGDSADTAIFDDIMGHSMLHDDNMFDESVIDTYISKLEQYGRNKQDMLRKYFGVSNGKTNI